MAARNKELYVDVTSSLIRWVKAQIEELQPDFPGLTYVDWDAHSEIRELPTADCLGPAGVGLTREDGGIYQVVMSIGISTINDPHLFRIRELASVVFGALHPEEQIPIYRAKTAAIGVEPTQTGWMVCQSPLILVPMSRAETRLLQFANVQALLDPRSPFVG